MKAKHHDFLPAVLEVQETPPSPLGRIIMWVVMTLLVISVVWAALGKVDIVAITRGKLVVNLLSRPVHSAVTAEIAQVFVKEGERVEKGQVLVRLNDTSLVAQREENILRQRLNTLNIQRLDILLKQYTDILIDGAEHDAENLLNQQDALSIPVSAHLHAEIAADRQEKQRYRNNQLTLQAQLQGFEAQQSMAQGQLPIYQKQYSALQLLYQRGGTSEDSLLEVRKRLLEANYSAQSALAKVREAQAAYQLSKVELSAYQADKIQKLQQERVERLTENALLTTQLSQLEAVLRQYQLRAPVTGTVESLVFRDAGAAVEAPQEVLKIVPDGEKLSAEVWVSNQDVGFLRLGQRVTVKIDTFDFTRYGWVTGTLSQLSTDAIEDKELGLVYKAVIQLEQELMNIEGAQRSLEPGMSVSAEIKTGKRTILSYLLSPMLEALDDVGKQR
ncbi:HlyD family type I secretion periplasmic adaptor subunit [Edaphovirga cremea]|uniref:HlyD family type I secretion periplasmic adaptor subunit n=1 Tax=Edaphovirga cremea TaxID=2267246 RepID=UPI00398932C8